jgi:large subunit ribosomal protein L13
LEVRVVKTYSARKGEIERRWFVVDATDQTLGRLATKIATMLMGKHKPVYTRHTDTGDFIIVVNAEKIACTGQKVDQKVYYRHTGYVGGQKQTTLRVMLERHPDQVVRRTVWGMIPHTSLGRDMIRKLKVYAGPDHPHAAQKPELLEITGAMGGGR